MPNVNKCDKCILIFNVYVEGLFIKSDKTYIYISPHIRVCIYHFTVVTCKFARTVKRIKMPNHLKAHGLKIQGVEGLMAGGPYIVFLWFQDFNSTCESLRL